MTSSSQSTPTDFVQDLIVLDPRLWFLVNIVCCVRAVLEQGIGMFSFLSLDTWFLFPAERLCKSEGWALKLRLGML